MFYNFLRTDPHERKNTHTHPPTYTTHTREKKKKKENIT